MRKFLISFIFLSITLNTFADEGLSKSQIANAPAEIISNPTGDLAKGTKPFQGISSIAVSPKGRVFVAWYGHGKTEDQNNYIMLSYSDDMGESWGDIKFIVRSPYCGKVRLFDPAMWTDKDGKVWLFWAQKGEPDLKEMSHRKHGVWCIVSDNADDKEIKWTAPRRLADGVMMCKPITLKSSEILFPIAFWQNTKYNDALTPLEGAGVWSSKDGGKTLAKIGNVKIPDVVFPEHILVEKSDSHIWLLSRRQPEFLKYKLGKDNATETVFDSYDGIVQAVSKDGGKSFGEVSVSKIPHTGSRFYVGRLNSGALVLVKNYADDAEWLANKPMPTPNKRIPRNKMLCYLSYDDGKTWTGGLVIDDRNGVSYPDLAQALDGTIYVTYDYSRYEAQEVYACRITEDDIKAGKLVNIKSKLKLLVNKGEVEFNQK